MMKLLAIAALLLLGCSEPVQFTPGLYRAVDERYEIDLCLIQDSAANLYVQQVKKKNQVVKTYIGRWGVSPSGNGLEDSKTLPICDSIPSLCDIEF